MSTPEDGRPHDSDQQPADAKQVEQPQSAASRSPEKAAHEAARRRRKAAREQREHDAGILKFTLLILASWIGIAALLAILLGWSWPIALVLVLLLMGYVAMREPDLRETILASSAVVGAAGFVTLNWGTLASEPRIVRRYGAVSISISQCKTRLPMCGFGSRSKSSIGLLGAVDYSVL